MIFDVSQFEERIDFYSEKRSDFRFIICLKKRDSAFLILRAQSAVTRSALRWKLTAKTPV
ncbi:MAG: hypothetical protein L6V93_23020 [Clostridiales bacterium]|nr:MAG: hypothetical protein L6V93_23020 [Clostridiales bacterium]